MSENMNWTAIGTWSALAAYNFGSYFYDYWKSRNQRKKIPTDYDRVIAGDTIDGWRPLETRTKWRNHEYTYYTRLTYPALGSDSSFEKPVSSFTLRHVEQIPDNRDVLFLRRYSLINPREEMELLRLIYSRYEWRQNISCYLTSRTIFTALRAQNSSKKFYIVLTDAYDGRNRHFVLKSPTRDADFVLRAYFVREPSLRLQVVFFKEIGRFNVDGSIDWFLEIFDASYEYPIADGSIITPMSSESIWIPLGRRQFARVFESGQAMVILFYDPDTLNENGVDHLCVSFDDQKKWSIDSFSDWLRSYRNTVMGKRVLEAHRSLANLSPPRNWHLIEVPEVQYFRHAVPYPIGGSILCFTADDGVLHRWIETPTLKQTAARAIFRANPGLKMETLERMVGFEISDGIVDDGDL